MALDPLLCCNSRIQYVLRNSIVKSLDRCFKAYKLNPRARIIQFALNN